MGAGAVGVGSVGAGAVGVGLVGLSLGVCFFLIHCCGLR